MSLLQFFLYAVGLIVVFGVLGWLINEWVPDTLKKLAWSALVVLGTVIVLYFLFNVLGSDQGLYLHK